MAASSLPVIQTPCLQRFPVEQRGFATSELSESNYQPRHVEMLTDPEVIETIKARSLLIRTVRRYFETNSFVEVATPILSALAGGASAKPFETTAGEFPDRKLNLRIAPELWLKRLIVGGMHKIFELGPCFRNEGLDKTHNPEYTSCEFYAVRHDLPRLMGMTRELLIEMADAMEKSAAADESLLFEALRGPYEEIDFIPALNAALGVDLPNLSSSSPETERELVEIFRHKDIPLPSNPTVPRLVDKLASVYLEPPPAPAPPREEGEDGKDGVRSTSSVRPRPTWIVNPPECLSPLAKSFIHPTAPNSQPVAARAELFVQGKEVVNCYEEENSPFEQRRKFLDQQRHGRRNVLASEKENSDVVVDEEAMKVDEDYLQALEWGLPPTGGWGCGIDRLVMLFTGKQRIGDVLTFGNLRAVTRGAEKRSV